MSKYFIKSDFAAFNEALATSEDSGVIANRMIVQERLRDLHLGGLKEFMLKRGLYPHWKEKTNLTNVLYPFFKANGGSVTYIRLGYAKSKSEIDAYAKRISLAKLSNSGYLTDDMAFHYLSQIQISLDAYSWDTAFYLGHHGWLEQNNLVRKISNINNRKEFERILDELLLDGYSLNIGDGFQTTTYKKSSAFSKALIDATNNSLAYTIYISKNKDEYSIENAKDTILDYVCGEFGKLLPLYRYVAWDIDNNYIGI